MVRIGVIGSRRRNSEDDCVLLFNEIEKRVKEYGPENVTLISGGCPTGGDFFAEVIQEELQLPNPMIIHYPDKNQLDPVLMKRSPRMAYAAINYARNTLIARDSDELIALVAVDRKGGTEDTIRKFKGFGKDSLILL
jgi:hypothetical protein